MPACLLSQDVLAICLMLADGDLDTSLEEVIRRAEHYQVTANRHFGISRRDFRGLFHWHTWRGPGILSHGPPPDTFRLGDVACEMLRYQDAYFNDEGEYWCIEFEEGTADLSIWARETHFYEDLDDAQWQEKLRQREAIHACFKNRSGATPDVDSVRGLMARLRITDAVLGALSRPGSES